MEQKTALVTGGSSGIGRETAKALTEKGYKVYGLARHFKQEEPFQTISCDVRDVNTVKAAVAYILAKEKRIDLVVNAAGYGISGAIEFTDPEDAKALFDTNFFGMVNVNQAVIPAMRKQGSGRIINISSVAAVAGIPFQAYYSASKAAIDSYSLALRNELRPFGISVCSILPGDIRTGFTAARKKSLEGNEIYQGRISRSVEGMEKDEVNGIDPSKAGALISKIAMKNSVAPQYTIGGLYKIAMVLLKLLPKRLSNALVYQLYAK